MSISINILLFFIGFITGIVFSIKLIKQTESPTTNNQQPTTVNVRKIKRSTLQYDSDRMNINPKPEPPAPSDKKNIKEYFKRKKL